MKKMFAWAVALCSMFCLTGCEEDLFPDDTLPANEWKSFTFQSLTGQDDLQITRSVSTGNGSDPGLASITTLPDSRHRFLAISTYSKNCEFCKEQAVWLDKLANDFSLQGIDFIIIFLDMFDNSDISQVQWVRKLQHVNAYTNATTACNESACRQIVAPHRRGPSAGSIYFVDKHDLENIEQGPDWYFADVPEEWYNRVRHKLEKYLHAQPVDFDAGVSDWVDHGSNDTNL